nr:MAG TPA: hypothetical protein [Caudoviricetes sp.]
MTPSTSTLPRAKKTLRSQISRIFGHKAREKKCTKNFW